LFAADAAMLRAATLFDALLASGFTRAPLWPLMPADAPMLFRDAAMPLLMLPPARCRYAPLRNIFASAMLPPRHAAAAMRRRYAIAAVTAPCATR
jgi:hypothetical protein